jgi:hypothetical protein
MIASILAIAVLRRRAGKALNIDAVTITEEFSPAHGEGLDLSRKQSVHA